MNKKLLLVSLAVMIVICFSFKDRIKRDTYANHYISSLNEFQSQQKVLLETIAQSSLTSNQSIEEIRTQLIATRNKLKPLDFWLRYLEPLSYKKINGPLPVEWETEVFEKFEKPYKREGAGLTLAMLYLEEPVIDKQQLLHLIQSSIDASKVYGADSITEDFKTHDHFYLCNRLFILNLAAIYTTGFECPDTERIIPELNLMLREVHHTYITFNESFADTPLSHEYLTLYQKTMDFVVAQPTDYEKFDHYTFLKDFVNPLFTLNQQLIKNYKVVSRSNVDYSLNKNAASIFDKSLYNGQNSKGIFVRVKDPAVLAEIDRIGKLLFYDPILSGNNLRSCASCHKPTQYFTDTLGTSALQFNRKDFLPRNTPSLLNVEYNHLIMMDGKHISLQDQTKGVMFEFSEMGSDEKTALKKVLDCKEYNTAFKKLLAYTPQEKEITYDHLVSAITFYYSKFSKGSAPFDNTMNENAPLKQEVKDGFNLFMSKAQCATCHFVPQFNGVKPPYVNSEFEVIGVPADTLFTKLSPDKGRYGINEAKETLHGFRTGSLRNVEHTAPYMHNGVFKNLNQVIDFYNAGGGAGRGLLVENQTLSADSLHLTGTEKRNLMAFIQSLNEEVPFEEPPLKLPASKNKLLNTRKVGGEY